MNKTIMLHYLAGGKYKSNQAGIITATMAKKIAFSVLDDDQDIEIYISYEDILKIELC